MFKKLNFAVLLLGLLLAMVIHPQASAEAAIFALNVWWQIVMPALLPFFICAELLLSLGVMNCFGIWLEPLMRPLFGLPGAAALAIVMGFTSGSPTGAAVTAGLRSHGLCSKKEGERLLAFTNNCSPLFILVAVAGSTLKVPACGMWLLIILYSFNLITGLVLGRLSSKNDRSTPGIYNKVLIRGLQELQKQKNASFGSILGQAAAKSMSSLLSIAGFMVFFAVVCRLLSELGLFLLITAPLSWLCRIGNLDIALSPALGQGLLEMTIGVAALPQTGAPLEDQIIAAAMIMGWSGLSIQAQVANMVRQTDLRLYLYIIVRTVQVVFSYLILKLFLPYLSATVTAPAEGIFPAMHNWYFLILSLTLMLILALISIFYAKVKISQ